MDNFKCAFLLDMICQLPTDAQNSFFKSLSEHGFSDDEIKVIQTMTAFRKMYKYPMHYDAVKNAVKTLMLEREVTQ